MGYSTRFEGTLSFVGEVTVADIRLMKLMFDEKFDDHPEWREHVRSQPNTKNIGWVDLCFTDNLDGIQWDGSEKTYGLEHVITALIAEVRKQNPSFGLSGELQAQGEDFDDRWILRIEHGRAVKVPVEVKSIRCPECGHEWEPEDEAERERPIVPHSKDCGGED